MDRRHLRDYFTFVRGLSEEKLELKEIRQMYNRS